MFKQVIVVGPPDVWRAVVKTVDRGCRVLAFTTLDELDRWRRSGGSEDPSIYPDLIAALAEAGRRISDLPAHLRAVLEKLRDETNVPPLRRLNEEWPSRSSFYRTWNAHIDMAPAAFLRRVRSLHASRLLAKGRTKKEAALLAGYSSVDQMRRNMRRE
jgi:transcriptional regulator GlxA family with amidase domain